MSSIPRRNVGRYCRWFLFFILLAIASIGLFGCHSSHFTLTVSVTPNGGGTVSPGNGVYDQGEQVTLTAIPATNYKFNGWIGSGLSGVGNSITITMNSNMTAVASFVKMTYDLQINQNIADGGEIEPKSGSYDAGTQVSVRAIPASGYRFDKWTGSISETTNPLNVLMDNTKNLTAIFVKIWNLSVTCSPEGSGSINPGTGAYDDGTKLELVATANFPYAFDHWGENKTDKIDPTDITLNGDTSITAYFTKLSSDTQQIITGIWNGSEILIPIHVTAGQWVELGISSLPNDIPVRTLDPNSNIVNDFGLTNAGNNSFQAQITGTYNIDVEASNSTNLAVYEVTYSVYSLPSSVVITPIPPITTPTPSRTTVIIAASDSNSQWKSEAIAICTGTSDQSVINSFLIPGIAVELAPGTYNCNGQIIPASNTTLYGQGDTTIINLGYDYKGNIQISNVSNINIGQLEIEGTLYHAAIYITATSNQSNFNIYNVTCLGPLNGGDCFSIVANGATISNVVFSDDDAISPDGFGFRLGGSGTVSNVVFYDDKVENEGIASTRSNDYMAGFDLADSGTVSNIYVINCSVNNSWESCFHMESTSTDQNVVLTGCNATGAGRKPNPTYGYGYLIIGDTIIYNNTASSNTNGALYINDQVDTSIFDAISPSDSKKTATAVNQGNCSGVMINIDTTHKELVLYSNDGNPVNQQIELGNYYKADDGEEYSFNGTKIIVQFTDYAVIKLINSGMLPNSQ